jgi:hypothetical protein
MNGLPPFLIVHQVTVNPSEVMSSSPVGTNRTRKAKDAVQTEAAHRARRKFPG